MPSINSEQNTILVVGPSWVGDMVMAQSLFIKLKQLNPQAKIDVLAPQWSRPILERMPEVRKAIDMPIGHGHFGLRARKSLGNILKQEAYDQAIVLPNSWKSALIPWFASIPIRTGWSGEARYLLLNDRRSFNKDKLPLMVQRFVSLAYPKAEAYLEQNIEKDNCPIPRIVVKKENINTVLLKYKLKLEKPVLVICPGAEFGPAKQWPAAYFATVSKEILDRGWQVWIMGSASDAEVARIISDAVKNKDLIDLCGKTLLEEAIDLISLANYVVSNDSGLMHIASALDKPLAAIYGATSPEFTPPLSSKAKTVLTDIECAPCFERHCPLEHHNCMKTILPEKVINLICN